MHWTLLFLTLTQSIKVLVSPFHIVASCTDHIRTTVHCTLLICAGEHGFCFKNSYLVCRLDRVLIDVWSDYTILQDFPHSGRNLHLYQKTSQRLEQMGIKQTWTQCWKCIKHLRLLCGRAQDSNSHSGTALCTCPFYNELDWVLSRISVQSRK